MNPFVKTEGIIWHAHLAWNGHLGGPGLERRLFRKTFHVDIPCSSAIVSVSAESRYILFVNGSRVSRGPVKGTPERYYYDTVDIAPFLEIGENVVSAEVRWFGTDGPISEVHTHRAGLVLQGPKDLGIDTPDGWKVVDDRALAADRTAWFSNSQQFLKSMEIVDFSKIPCNWQVAGYDDSTWEDAVDAGDIGNLTVWGTTETPFLVPMEIAPLLEEERRFDRVLDRDGDSWAEATMPNQDGASYILDGFAEIILDAGALTTGFPVLSFSGGTGCRVEVIYGECALFREGEGSGINAPDGPWYKGVRDNIECGDVAGYRDSLLLDGTDITWEPFLWRTFWYIKVRIEAGQENATITDCSYRYTTYPVERKAVFTCDKPEYTHFLEMGWRTLRLCSHDTFEDCPYYEQLHYLGDARLEALTHMYLTGDTAYVRRSISLYRDSSRWNGLVMSRTPSFSTQVIPYFALLWILMIEDFWEYAGASEKDFVTTCLHAMDGVLTFFRARLRQDGFVGKVGPWNMVDQATEWKQGEPPAVAEGGSTYLTCLFIRCMRAAIRIHTEVGDPIDAERWMDLSNRLIPVVRNDAWSPDEGLFLEGPNRLDDRYSQHSQVMAILSGVATEDQIRSIRQRLVSDPSLISMKLMQSFYLARALELIGDYDSFHSAVLRPWHEMKEMHLSTCTEYWPPGRSDCHAWSSWPLTDFMRSILGVRPGLPGFESILIRPQTAALGRASGMVPTPKGPVAVSWERLKAGEISLHGSAPEGVPTVIIMPSGKEHHFEHGGIFEATDPIQTE